MESPALVTHTDIPGWTSTNELALLASLARRVPAGGAIIELGSFAGRTAWIMARNAPQAQVYCIDLWGHFDIRWIPEKPLSYMGGALERFRPGELFAFFRNNTEDCPNIVPVRGKSQEVSWAGRPAGDLIFVDADHDTQPLLEDLKVWWPRLAAGGLMIGHDWQMETVRQALLQFLRHLNDGGQYPQLINFPGVSIWGLLLGLDHARRWGMNFDALYPLGDSHFIQPRPIEEVQAGVAEATRGLPPLKARA